MSCNITGFNVKKMENLRIPLPALLEEYGEVVISKERAYLDTGGETEIYGVYENNAFVVTSVSIYGEGSGNVFWNYFLPALEESSGVFEALLMFEDGEIKHLKSENGCVDLRDIEI